MFQEEDGGWVWAKIACYSQKKHMGLYVLTYSGVTLPAYFCYVFPPDAIDKPVQIDFIQNKKVVLSLTTSLT